LKINPCVKIASYVLLSLEMAIYYAKSLMKAQLLKKVNTKIIQKLKRFVTLGEKNQKCVHTKVKKSSQITKNINC
jgi:hypothetical protein